MCCSNNNYRLCIDSLFPPSLPLSLSLLSPSFPLSQHTGELEPLQDSLFVLVPQPCGNSCSLPPHTKLRPRLKPCTEIRRHRDHCWDSEGDWSACTINWVPNLFVPPPPAARAERAHVTREDPVRSADVVAAERRVSVAQGEAELCPCHHGGGAGIKNQKKEVRTTIIVVFKLLFLDNLSLIAKKSIYLHV